MFLQPFNDQNQQYVNSSISPSTRVWFTVFSHFWTTIEVYGTEELAAISVLGSIDGFGFLMVIEGKSVAPAPCSPGRRLVYLQFLFDT